MQVDNKGTAMEFDVLTGALGAEVSGLNLNEPLSGAEVDALHQGLIQHQVLFFRDQQLTPESHLALAAALGDIDPGHPVYPHVEGFQSIVELIADADNVPDTEDWHKDLTFRPNPPFASILRAVQVPSSGGDTLWANMGAVYDSLSAGWKSDLQALQAIHDMGTFRNDYFQRGGIKAIDKALSEVGSAVHDVVARSFESSHAHQRKAPESFHSCVHHCHLPPQILPLCPSGHRSCPL